ncbi:nickel-dependent hydrogenase large subunit [Hoeflea sp.]|uniref:nickel-dependent hydrogenase large subunit n=1 Tax=Hoeflea sp. TaxID=1940281 RepID=UPI002AFFEDA2|nr:nickel-dependent hydrogenase large subunit [Hoeflea sp.]
MMLEGKVEIILGKGRGSAVRHDRTVNISPMLGGRSPAEAITCISSVYGVCANAQSHAAVLALEATIGVAPDRQTACARVLVTSMETLRENVLRIALEWPRFFGGEPEGASVRPVIGYVPRIRHALFGSRNPFAIGAGCVPDRVAALAVIDEAEALLADGIFGEPLEVWRARRGMAGFADWCALRRTAAARMIANLSERNWIHMADAGRDAVGLPHTGSAVAWPRLLAGNSRRVPFALQDGVPETTLFSRRLAEGPVESLNSSGLGARFIARLAELACLPAEMRLLLDGQGEPGMMTETDDGTGIGIVEAARGLLIHTVGLRDGRVDAYRIVSPTDWNFDSRGIAARCLATLDGHDEADRISLAHLVVNAIDPCVAYQVRAA